MDDASARGGRCAAFIDRDGTLIVEREYLADPAGVQLVPGAAAALRRLRDAGYALVVVTNQSGIARGYYSEDDYHAVAARLDEILEAAGAPLDATYYCPHAEGAGSAPCACRKPGTGMYRVAARDLGLDLSRSFYIGDKLADVLPAAALGGTGILVRTGYGAESEGAVPDGVVVLDDLAAAAAWILGSRGACR